MLYYNLLYSTILSYTRCSSIPSANLERWAGLPGEAQKQMRVPEEPGPLPWPSWNDFSTPWHWAPL